ncbi:GIY-YIG nuclease family protein [Aliivibrio fischeri]|uniref:Bacteriophage T5 Orf172 DNA-binding domain-containing protein n=1 Tax=Aliivibrio fischeri TaxID=668 RepID=A0A510UNY9_ALIFS|nr:GIY-YIG nuclease family protein [Aliivibrio fischeri]MUK51571.1 hypothetical protein [Aliivibrio fischeri]GEK16259.1 hypothetical protein AFI02nite_42950 [Aliivibrio fischeri]
MGSKIVDRYIVYFIQGEITQKIKIGQTRGMVDERMSELQTGSPDQLVHLGSYIGHELTEDDLRKKFKSHLSHGEWFYPNTDIYDFISKNCIKDIQAIYHTYDQIEKGSLTFEEAMSLGEERLVSDSKKYMDEVVKSISF